MFQDCPALLPDAQSLDFAEFMALGVPTVHGQRPDAALCNLAGAAAVAAAAALTLPPPAKLIPPKRTPAVPWAAV